MDGPGGLRRFLSFRPRLSLRMLRNGAVLLVLLATLNWTVGALMVHRIDNDLTFSPPAHLTGGSRAVSMAAALIDREVNENAWTPNDPWFAPSTFLDNMPSYQTGVMRAVARFSFELLDGIARTRGSSSNDPDLERAAGFLQFPPDFWIFNFEKSLLPMVPSEDQYRSGLNFLTRYNQRLANGNAIFERRADAFGRTIQQVSLDLGAQTAAIERTRQGGWWIFNTSADDVFYQNKGMLYAYYMILSELGHDFEHLIRERGLTLVWTRALQNLERATQLRPTVVLNGNSDRSIFANHLMLQGFYLKRAILQLEEAVSVLAV
ncbi:DUF2333 family protein [Tateyamaria sp. ANG-S1]|uniref:DUF2333 family protein n=1 Tax=Tateyamaria sp. ANG-S1 TaxID=1577905 RepID=UPI00057EF0B3|nr:DUF2333 family protein [Tateyamaria sp. ANG-S1]KIC48147.1 hypothetical protein RA29_17740 [Tateyamaria sp. ANG-S1]